MGDSGGDQPQGTGEFSHWEGLRRLGKIYELATYRVKDGEDPPPPPDEVLQWAQYTCLGTLAGILVGGSRQALQHRREGPVQPPPEGSLPTKLHVAKHIADANTQRLAKTLSQSIRGGWQIGGLTGLYYALRQLGDVYRGCHDAWSTAGAALATGAVAGACVPGGAGVRARSSLVMAALGGLVAVPMSQLQQYVDDLDPEAAAAKRERTAQAAASRKRPYTPRDYDAAAVVVERLKASLPSSAEPGGGSGSGQGGGASNLEDGGQQRGPSSGGGGSWLKPWTWGTGGSGGAKASQSGGGSSSDGSSGGGGGGGSEAQPPA